MPNDEKHKWYDEDIVEAAIDIVMNDVLVLSLRCLIDHDDVEGLFTKPDLEHMLAMLENDDG